MDKLFKVVIVLCLLSFTSAVMNSVLTSCTAECNDNSSLKFE